MAIDDIKLNKYLNSFFKLKEILFVDFSTGRPKGVCKKTFELKNSFSDLAIISISIWSKYFVTFVSKA